MRMPGQVARQHFQHIAEGLGAAGRDADAHDPFRRLVATRLGTGGGMIASAVSLLLDRRRAAARPHPRRAADLTAWRKPVPTISISACAYRYEASAGYRRRRPRTPRTSGCEPCLGQRRADDHRDWTLRHDLAQEGHPVHARHLDVEEDHIGQFVLETSRGCERVGDVQPSPRCPDPRSESMMRIWRTDAESSTIRTRSFCSYMPTSSSRFSMPEDGRLNLLQTDRAAAGPSIPNGLPSDSRPAADAMQSRSTTLRWVALSK